ncbi:hypothetical protein [Hylemonella gracilis]|uniref:C-type lysozyme inhibitor domain-containing protein n=1 Tax=Hylemonella gracilis ATCC 19624 TaxID=887062 RepID=F3KWX7_9BURK|nr:hypothetical protein [Hylemonella gracilis]EGI75764.1 hypothetical protein HGR_14829 [Hylemonella gracilis ATCC 19624]
MKLVFMNRLAPVVPAVSFRSLVLGGLLSLQPLAWADALVNYRCEPVYQPARNVWVRTVGLVHDDKKITEVRIDGVPVYSFNVHGARVLTALDNERIAFDADQLSWQSDWRGVMQAQGRCERASD